ncbi:DUF2970 domain-containing protein [soil metagenome]
MPDALPPQDRPTARRGSIVATVKAVLWSFFGVRRSAAHDSDIKNLNPVTVIVTAVVLTACFIVALLLIVRWVVASAAH